MSTKKYKNMSPIPNKLIQPDGTETTMQGDVPVNPSRRWLNSVGLVNKTLEPDGTEGLLNIGGGGGSGGGGITVERDPLYTADKPNLALKVNVYTKTEIDDKLSTLPTGDVYTKSESDAKYSTKTESDTKYATKSEIIDSYTKIETDSKYAGKSDTYTKSEVDSKLENLPTGDVYTKSESDTLFSTKTELTAHAGNDTHLTPVQKTQLLELDSDFATVYATIEQKLQPFNNIFIAPSNSDMQLLEAEINDVCIVQVDEEPHFELTTMYLYNGSSWEFLTELTVKVRDFTANPIDLATEVTGMIPESRIPPEIARISDITGLYDGINKKLQDRLEGKT